jgi:hypothetical protein
MQAQRPWQITSTESKAVADVAQDIKPNGRTFMISNAGSQPIYITNKDVQGAATANSFMIPANTLLPQLFYCDNLSVISNATGSSVSILYLDI